MNVLIIEDEAIAADRLSQLLRRAEPAAKIAGMTQSIEGTVNWFQANTAPDLVLMDINLADGGCFSIFDIIDIRAPIIFCTAYDEYALKAFQANSIAYLLKPILESDLRSALDKLETIRESNHGEKNRHILKTFGNNTASYKSRFLIKTGGKLIPVPIEQIACFLTQEQGVKLYLDSGESYFLDYTVTELEALLDPMKFFRISRQAIIAGEKIKTATSNIRNASVRMVNIPYILPVARERAKAFHQWFDA